jgi:hypothetical protein
MNLLLKDKKARSKLLIVCLVFLSLLFLAIVIVNAFSVSLSGGANLNVTYENNFTHLNISDGSLVFYMPFDVVEDSENKTYDYTNNSNDGTLNNGVLFNSTGGIYGGAYTFDGVDDGISTSSFALNSSLNQTTYSFWVYHNINVSADLNGQNYITDASWSNTVPSIWIFRHHTLPNYLAFQ